MGGRGAAQRPKDSGFLGILCDIPEKTSLVLFAKTLMLSQSQRTEPIQLFPQLGPTLHQAQKLAKKSEEMFTF